MGGIKIKTKWQQKAIIMRICASVPLGNRLYKWGQKRFGRLRADPMERLPAQVNMAQSLREQGMPLEGRKFFEIGTGHIPLVPIGFFLSGAAQIITVDLHRRIDWELTRNCLVWIGTHYSEISGLYAKVVPKDIFDERFDVIKKWSDLPSRFLKEANIEYMAPMDAAHTDMLSQSVDCHFSITVLEHIPLPTLTDIFKEAKRILKSTGIAVHFVDLSDHFQHQDKSITPINFLKFSNLEWSRIAGNEFAYCNRLRASDYLRLFQQLGFSIEKNETLIDQESLHCLKNGFSIDSQYHAYTNDDLSVTTLNIMIRFKET